jgi:hypothetical protein
MGKHCLNCNIPYTKGIHVETGCQRCKTPELEKWRKIRKLYIKPFFRWYDLWMGLYIDKPNNTVYFCPVPMLGIKIRINKEIR